VSTRSGRSRRLTAAARPAAETGSLRHDDPRPQTQRRDHAVCRPLPPPPRSNGKIIAVRRGYEVLGSIH
jgi:hypothetical protein